MKKHFFKNKQLLQFIQKTDKKFVIFGLSETTKNLLKQYSFLSSKILFIVDNNYKNLVKNFNDIPIENPTILTNENVLLWGNHVNSILKQLYNTNCRCYIDYDLSKTNLLPKDFIFYIETPNKTSNINDINHKFAKSLIDFCYGYYRKINIEAIEFNLIYHLKPRKVKKNSLLISYHSIGKPNKQILRWKEGYLNNMITFDFKGYSGWSSLCDIDVDKLLKNISQKKANEYFDTLATKYITNNQSKYIQPKQQNFNFPKEDFIFFPLQTINDSVMEHSYFKPLKLIKKVIKIISSKNIPLVIKQHPRCNNQELKQLLQQYENEKKIILFNGSIHEAISKATTVYTINSGVGFESLLHLKPVVTFGSSDYMSMTKNIKNLDIIKKEPFYILSTEEENRIKKFIYYYIKKKCVFLDDEKNIEKFIYKIIKKSVI